MENKTISEIKRVLTERKCIYTECEKLKKEILNLLKNKVIINKGEFEDILFNNVDWFIICLNCRDFSNRCKCGDKKDNMVFIHLDDTLNVFQRLTQENIIDNLPESIGVPEKKLLRLDKKNKKKRQDHNLKGD